MSFWKWSRTAATNASADGSINWAEGQPPSSVNDSARAMMAAASKYRDDIAGAIATGGTSTAYTVTSYQVFDTLAHMDGAMIAFTPHTTNGATVTLNVDGLGAKALRSSPNVELPSGTLIQGTPYVATYNNSDSAFYLQGGTYNPYNIPIGGLLPYTGSSAPNSAFVFPYGQAISRTSYATYFAMMGNTYGAGDGSTTFNVIDLRGRVIAGLDNMGGTNAGRLSTLSSTTLGASGGEQTHQLTPTELAGHTHVAAGNTAGVNGNHQHTIQTSNAYQAASSGGSFQALSNAAGSVVLGTTGVDSPDHSHAFSTTTTSAGGNGFHNNIQPTIIINYILRII